MSRAVRECTAPLLLKSGLIVLLALVCGTGQSLFLNSTELFGESTTKEISLEAARAAFEEGSAVFIDARPLAAYAEGHIPGALNIPVRESEPFAYDRLSRVTLDTDIITYCADTSCQSSSTLAERLQEELGYRRIRTFIGGWPEWQKAGLPASTGVTP